MPKPNGFLTKAYSGRVRSSQIPGQNRTQGECTDNYYQGVCGFAHTPPLLHVVQVLHGMHHMHVVHHLRPLHPMHHVHPDPKGRISDRPLTAPMHHVHQCTTFTTTAGGGKSFRPSRCDTCAPLSSRIHSWPDDPKGGTIEAE